MSSNLKSKLTLNQVYSFLTSIGADPILQEQNGIIVSRTRCHNDAHEGSYKLYYYDNSKLFVCYTNDCGNGFLDIYHLADLVLNLNGYKHGIHYIYNFFGEDTSFPKEKRLEATIKDWRILDRKKELLSLEQEEKEIITLDEVDKTILKYYPTVRIKDWEDEGITFQVLLENGIKYDPVNQAILIPHYDKDNRLIGIRSRTLIKMNEIYGKYLPSILGGNHYNHPLSLNLYGLNKAKENIKKTKIAIVVEAEKSVLKYESFFGVENNLCVAICGSSFSNYQFNLLKEYGVEELIFGLDKDFQEIGDKDYLKLITKLEKIKNKYSKFIKVSFLFDKNNSLLGYKDSPLDKGKEVFEYLLKDRIY